MKRIGTETAFGVNEGTAFTAETQRNSNSFSAEDAEERGGLHTTRCQPATSPDLFLGTAARGATRSVPSGRPTKNPGALREGISSCAVLCVSATLR